MKIFWDQFETVGMTIEDAETLRDSGLELELSLDHTVINGIYDLKIEEED